MDNDGYPVTFEFDLVEGKSPLIIGLDAAQYANTCNRTDPRTFSIKRPQDRRLYTLHTYTAPDEHDSNRLRLQVVPQSDSQIRTMVASNGPHRELTMAKRIHRFGHANAREMERIMRPMKFDENMVRKVCDRVQSACPICASTGRPTDRKKISTTHLNSAFNQEVQADYVYITIHGKRHEVLNVIDTGTKYGERIITTSRSAEDMKGQFERIWFYRHGAPSNFSADHEFCRPVLRRFLTRHSIIIHPRPSRSSNKTGIVERNNGVLKTVLDKIQRADAHGTPELILARASFITNMMRGSKIMSAFQMARGYMPSILGIPRSIVSEEILEAHIERESVRALERIMRSKSPDVIDPAQITPGTRVMVFHNSTKHTEPNEWVPAVVVSADEHIVTCRRSQRGPPMNVSHNDLRIMPSGELTDQLMRYECSDDVFDDSRNTNKHVSADSIEDSGKGAIHDGHMTSEQRVGQREPNDYNEDIGKELTPTDGPSDDAPKTADPNERVASEANEGAKPRDSTLIATVGHRDCRGADLIDKPGKGVMTINENGRNMTGVPTDGTEGTMNLEGNMGTRRGHALKETHVAENTVEHR